MTASDEQIGIRLRLWSQQVEGYYHEADGKKRFFAVPGVYRVTKREELGNNVTVIHLQSETSGAVFECSLYYLVAILGPWSHPDEQEPRP